MINFDDISNTSNGGKVFEAMPLGWYGLKCTKAEVTKAASSGNLMIKTEFTITSPDEYKSRKVWNNFSLVPQAIWILKTFLDAAGSDIASGNVDEKKIAIEMIGLTAEAHLEPGTTPTGKPKNDVNNFRKIEDNVSTSAVKNEMFK